MPPREIRPGDLVVRPARTVGDHYGVYGGNGLVLDIRKLGSGRATVRVVTIEKFFGRHRRRFEPAPEDMCPEEARERGRKLLTMGTIKYSALGFGDGANCEHVARWVQTGKLVSRQATSVKVGLVLGGLVAAAVALWPVESPPPRNGRRGR